MPESIFSSPPDQTEVLSRGQDGLDRINAEIAAHQLGLQRKSGDPRTRNRIKGAIRNLEAKRDKFLFTK